MTLSIVKHHGVLEGFMTHPKTVVYLEHDGKVLLVDVEGNGPINPINGRILATESMIRFPTVAEVNNMQIEFEQKRTISIDFDGMKYDVIKAYPKISWPKDWAWKDNVFTDNLIHPIVRESIYRSIHRLVSKVIIRNSTGEVLLAKVKRGHFTGHWSLPGGYMDHDEHPSIGCVRETLEELGIDITLKQSTPVITQKIFNDDGISFVSFTYQSQWEGDISDLKLQTEEIEEAKWFTLEDAKRIAVSYFDSEALKKY